METVTVSQPSQIAISLFGECSDTPLIFCVSNDNDAFEAVTPVTAYDRRSPRIKRDCHSLFDAIFRVSFAVSLSQSSQARKS